MKKRCEKAGPVGDVEVCADATVVIMPAAMTSETVRIDLRMFSSGGFGCGDHTGVEEKITAARAALR